MEISPTKLSPKVDRPPYEPPSQGDGLFYLLLTVTASTVVYKSFPKRLRGIATIGVASFGIYHAFGMNCDCIKHVFARIFGNFPGGSGSGGGSMKDWGCFTRLPWETTPYGSGSHSMSRSPSSHTGGVDHTQRQGKRPRNLHEEWKGERSESPPPLSPFSTLTHTSTHPLPSSFPSVGAVDTSERRVKRSVERGSSWETEARRSPSPTHDQTPYTVPTFYPGSVDRGQRQQKRRGETDW